MFLSQINFFKGVSSKSINRNFQLKGVREKLTNIVFSIVVYSGEFSKFQNIC